MKCVVRGILVVLVASSLFGCSKEEVPQDLSSIAKVEYKGDIYEAKVSYPEQKVYTFSNENLIASKDALIGNPEDESSIMKLNDYSELDSKDVTTSEAYILPYVWKTSIQGSEQQLKYYSDQGYKEIFRGETQEFIEVYMKKDSNIKRIIITDSMISIIDIDSNNVNFNSIDDYISYKIGGNN